MAWSPKPRPALFRAAIIPGLLLGGLYIVYIVIRTRLNPLLLLRTGEVTLRDRVVALKGPLPPVLLVTAILGRFTAASPASPRPPPSAVSAPFY